MMENKKENSATILTGLSNILKIVGAKKVLTNGVFIVSLVVSLIFMLCTHLSGKEIYDVIKETKNLVINFLPAILGFTIAGYTLVIGFIQSSMLKRIGQKSEKSDYSLYQIISANFALDILVQVFALMFAYALHYAIFFQENTASFFDLSNSTIGRINSAVLFLLMFGFTLSLLMLAQIVINIFDFSQLHHYFITKDETPKNGVE